MTTLLRVDSSPRDNSISRALGDAFERTWRAAHPDGRVLTRDLARVPVPFIDAAWTEICDHLLAHRITDLDRLSEAARTPDQKRAWAIVEPLLTELRAADVVLITTPMHNFSIPAVLKAWLDQVTFPRMSLAGKRFVVATARGGAYSPGAPKAKFDYQERYLRDFFAGHFAVDDARFVNAELANARVDPLLADHRTTHESSYADAIATAAELGGKY
ncbi:FMN-dependent NADH-azoreductase [Stackebrandtia nassauensis]|uniref:FMN dependent NADH:quinone oxidoreductase n=1 Tax=Stackebrandtia nassauensis (strain DSM 44728 / CIP 108903 / NRRL B-16338 / NBRC 102104 / LLR-40K-21) TaxID=446470 RepID=D3PX90_STANL|nr:NAD(P)H-dependent oxidoreductase [Stackebrandtia nassauensis]ADD41353.1 NAD(P)H dehydrogenase (quinone) [Stackebrandtia nassauensis DSM 44728]